MLKRNLMGRKTKKEKIIAQYRRKLQTLGIQNSSPYKVVDMPKIQSEQKTNPTNEIFHNLQVTKDLKKILFLTTLAICAQLVLWYALGKQGR